MYFDLEKLLVDSQKNIKLYRYCIFSNDENGYAINAVIGKKDYFSNAEETFISSVFWTERIGSVTGLKTIDNGKEKSWDYITKMGLEVRSSVLLLHVIMI